MPQKVSEYMTTSEQRSRRAVRMQPGRDAPAEPPPATTARRPRPIESATIQPQGLPSDKPTGKGELPPFGLIVARPLLLLVAALLGASCGFLLTGNSGYQAQSMLQFSTPSLDSLVVKQTGQTLARRVLSADVVAEAEKRAGVAAGAFAGQITAGWEQDSNLVEVTAQAPTEAGAIAAANAVAGAVVRINESQIEAELRQAHSNSSDLLNAEGLPSPAAEDARQAQVGQSLANRQDSITARSGSVVVIDPAAQAAHAGITPAMGSLIGLVAGLLLGGLAAVLIGVRGLRVSSMRSLRTLFPGYRISGTRQAARLAGEILESGRDCIAVVCPEGSREAGLALADDLSAFVGAHGHLVRNLGLVDDRTMALATLGRDTRRDVPGIMGADIMIAVVDADSEAAHLLEGQSDFVAVVVARRRRTTVAATAAAMEAFDRAAPRLVLAR